MPCRQYITCRMQSEAVQDQDIMNVMQAVHQVYGMQPRPCNKVSHVKSQGIMSGRHPPTVDATAGTHPPTHPPWTPPHVGLYIVHKHRTAGEGQQQGRSRAVSGQLTKSYRSGLGLSRCLGPGECLHSFIHKELGFGLLMLMPLS